MSLAPDMTWSSNNNKSIILLLLFLFHTSLLHAEEIKGHGVEVRLTSPKISDIEPGRIVTGSFLVSHSSEDEEVFSEELNLPADWQILVPDGNPFTLSAKGREVKVIAFSVPVTAPAGIYTVTYSIRSRRDYGITDNDSFSVVVLPVLKLQVIIEDKPDVVIAGDTYDVKARLINRGNSRQTVAIEIKGTHDYHMKIEPAEVTLDPGKSQILRIQIQTDNKLKEKITYILSINAKTEKSENGGISSEQSASVVIIPRMTGEFDPYHRLTANLKFTSVSEDGSSGFQTELSGSGSLDEEGKNRIDFLFRTPDIQDKSMFGERDEYRVSYYNPLFDLHFGDRSYTLSPLTERYKYGKGLEVNIHPGNFGAGAFYLETRWDKPEQKEFGTYVRYKFREGFSVQGNFLDKSIKLNSSSENKDKIYSVQSEINLNEKMNIDVEYGLDNSDRVEKSSGTAYKLRLNGQLSDRTSYFFEKVYAGPKFFGYYNDTDFTTGAITVPIYRKLLWTFSFHILKDNLDFESLLKSIANKETVYRTGFSYSLPSGTVTSLEYEKFHREDRLLPSDYNFIEKVYILGLGQTFKKTGFQTYIERGNLQNKLSDNLSTGLERYSLYSYFNLSEKMTFSFYAITGHERYAAAPERTKSVGISAAWRPVNNFKVNINYQQNYLNQEKNRRQDSQISNIIYTLPNQHFLTFRSYWARRKGIKEESSFTLSYTIPMQIPVSKKKSIGMLKGIVYDVENKNTPIPNVVLSVGEATAVTDLQGEFIFPSLKPGSYFLKIEKGSIGLNRVITEKLPVSAEVKGGETERIEIDVVTACRIAGKIKVFDFLNHDKNSLQDTGGLSNTLLEITDGKEIIRKLTDEDGSFSFEDIRPGKWAIKIYGDNLPLHHYLETGEFTVDLTAGEAKEFSIRVLPRDRTISILEEEKL
ncbi:MAG: hypothetical protein HZB30_07350 [Nitrospirae bacterium]|nr:hypothetical protein [Nitrospirota bacterium]